MEPGTVNTYTILHLIHSYGSNAIHKRGFGVDGTGAILTSLRTIISALKESKS